MPMTEDEWTRLVNAVREACIRAAQDGYADAAASGLCDEGAFEAAIGAVRMLDLSDAAKLNQALPGGKSDKPK